MGPESIWGPTNHVLLHDANPIYTGQSSDESSEENRTWQRSNQPNFYSRPFPKNHPKPELTDALNDVLFLWFFDGQNTGFWLITRAPK